MATTAQSIIALAQELLLDKQGVRWPATELVAHLNDGQRAVVELRPDATAKDETLTLVAGVSQTIPAEANSLIEIVRNVGGKQRPVRQVVRNTIDAVDPAWYSSQPKGEVLHFMTDARQPRQFDVYPPVLAGTKVLAILSMTPTDVPQPSGVDSSTVTGHISLGDTFKNALLHFVLFRAFAKDAEVGSAASSASHYQLFKTCLGDETGSRQVVKPTVIDSPAITG